MGIRVAILGAGNMGKGHARRLKSAGAEVVCVCDKNEAARKSFMDEIQDEGIEGYGDFDEMLEKAKFQALFICVPPFAQNGQFEKAAAKGIHIFIEKPIALTTEAGKKMVSAAEENNIITRVGFHMRQGTAVKKLKEMIAAGRTGRPVLFHGHYSCNSLHTSWWPNVDLCGGQIFEQAIHVYDICRDLMGEPKNVSGIMNNLCHNDLCGYTVEDVSASIASFSNGAVASVTANNCEVPGLWIGSFKAVYENVTVDFKDCNHAVFTYTDMEPVKNEAVESEADPYMDEVEEFIHCIQEGHDTSCNIKEGYKSLCYVEKVVQSARMDGIKVPVY